MIECLSTLEIRMNIFFLHRDPSRAAKAQCDKHVVKMVLETTQMLSTAAIRNGRKAIYKPAYPNHPMTKWVNTHKNNYLWACEHGLALCDEYTKRYNKIHKSQQLIKQLHDLCKSFFTFGGGEPNSSFITSPPLCMPDEFKQDDFVEAYKEYYKAKLLSWKIPPRWRLDQPDGVVC